MVVLLCLSSACKLQLPALICLDCVSVSAQLSVKHIHWPMTFLTNNTCDYHFAVILDCKQKPFVISQPYKPSNDDDTLLWGGVAFKLYYVKPALVCRKKHTMSPEWQRFPQGSTTKQSHDTFDRLQMVTQWLLGWKNSSSASKPVHTVVAGAKTVLCFLAEVLIQCVSKSARLTGSKYTVAFTCLYTV